jgi:uncharacterized protein YkwD
MKERDKQKATLRPVIWLAVISCVLLAVFLWFRPVISGLGRPRVPDTTGRARHPVPDGVTAPATAGPSTASAPSAPDLTGISHPEALERKILELVNEERRKDGSSPLQPESTLDSIARGHSDDMLARGFFDHLNPDGLAASDRVAINHRRLIGTCSENIWKGSGLDPSDVNKLATEMMYGENGWMNSADHRANILRREFTHLGVGISIRGSEVRATQNFAMVRAYTEQPVPAQISSGASLKLASTPFNSGSAADKYDYWISNRGINTGESYPVAGSTVKVGTGVYKLRFYFPRSGSDPAASYSIYNGPQIEVK